LRHFINEKSFKNGLSTEDYLNNNQIKLEWSIELFEGLSFMHSKNIVHRDINPK
jgi:serine/threonine protein kinase